jgi:acetyl-CoA acetyltransferase family protein
MGLQNVVIVDGMRSAFGRGARGKLVATRLDEAGAKVLRALLDRNPKVQDRMIEDIGMGTVSPASEYGRLGTVARLAGLPFEVPNFSSNRQCGASMETLHRVAMAIAVGSIECGIALGVERMGRTLMPSGAASQPVSRVLSANKRWVEMNDVQRSMAPDHREYFSVPIPDYILNSTPLQNMPQTAQNVVEMYDLTRRELDEFSAASHRRLAAAYERGVYKDEIVALEVENPVYDNDGNWLENEQGPMITFDRDECLRPDTTAEKLATLPAIKGVQSFGGKEVRVTAGNSCPTNDGVSACLLMSEKKALALGLSPLARVIGLGVGGVKPQIMGLGPVVSTKKALKHAGIGAEKIDRVEFNEAFAAQVLPSIRELGIAADKVNVNGGSIGIGHPIGATGARLVLTVAKELRRSRTRYGLATQCIGAGMGISTILERLD